MGPLWAVHIADAVLTWPWLAGGFTLAALLALVAGYRVRDEEIPRIALLSAAFFVASLMHVRLGPTSVHLLLNGLVGVVLGRRAGLAIALGLFLQWVLLGHGGVTTLGVNTCVLTLPALLAGWLFAELHRLGWVRHPAARAALVAAGTLAWSLGIVFAVVLVATNPWGRLLAPDPDRALAALRLPAVLGGALLLAVAVAWGERRLGTAPEFALGFVVGVTAVVATLALNGLVLLLGGAEDWHQIVLVVFAAHVPVAVIEGVVLGFAASFLARVKPELLGITEASAHWHPPDVEPRANGIHSPPAGLTPAPPADAVSPHPPALLLALLALGLAAAPAHAHRLNADYRVLPGQKVQVESWFSISKESPRGALVQVFRPNDQLLAEEHLDDKGVCVFRYTHAEPLRVVVSAGAGHRKEFVIPADKLPAAAGETGDKASESPRHGDALAERETFADRSSDVTGKDVLLGVTFLLALSAFVLSLRNARRQHHR
jgi:cobalt/nickel transport system permease protein